MADGLDRLLLDAVVGRDHQHHDVGDVGAARAHRGEGLMARRVDEGDALAALQHDLVGADMLGDAAGLAAHHVGLAQRVEERGLAVIDMAHDGDDGRPRDQRFGLVALIAAQSDLDVGLGDAADLVAELGDDDLGGVGVDRLVDGRHHAHADERLHHVGAALGHAVGQFLHRDVLGHHHVAHDLALVLELLQRALLLALAVAADRGEAALALALVVVQHLGDGELAGAAARLVAARDGRRLLDLDARAGALGGRFLLGLLVGLDLARRGQRRDLGGGGLAGALGHLAARILLNLLGLAPRLILDAARLLVDLAAGLLLGAAMGLVFGLAAWLALRRGAASSRSCSASMTAFWRASSSARIAPFKARARCARSSAVRPCGRTIGRRAGAAAGAADAAGAS